jgi:hypothetical protein
MPNSQNQDRQRVIASAIVGAVIAILIAIFALSRYRTMNAPPPRPYDVAITSPAPKATPAPPERTPRPTPQPGAPDLRLKFQRSDAPMTGVVVLVQGRPPLDLPANGEIDLLPEGVPVRIHDRETSVTMVDLPDGGVLRGVVELPPPVRLAGRLVDPAGGSVTALALSWGHGEEVTVAERERRRTGSMLRPSPNESSPWGIDLPPGPAEWQELKPAADGTFTTKWFLAAGAAPSVVAFDATGRSAFARVPFADTLLPRATMDAGTMTIQDPAALEIEVDFPPGERAADLAAGIRWAKVLPEYAEQSAMILNLLDRIDPQVASFASGEGNYPVVRPGVTRIAPLPPLGPLLLVMRGPMPSKVPEREIALKPGETTRVHITAEEIFPIGGPTYDAEFRVVLKGTLIPIKDAKIVVSMWRRSEEGITDELGAFHVKDLPADQQIQIQVDAYDTNDPPRYAESKSTKLYLDSYGNGHPIYIDIAGFRWIVLERGNLVARGMPGGEPIISLLQWSKPESKWKVENVDDSSFSDADLWVNFSFPGRYKFEIQTEPLVIFESTEVELGPDDFFGEVSLIPAAHATREVKIFVHDEAGNPVSGLEVEISEGAMIGKSSTVVQVVTDADGMASVGPCNVDRLRYSYMDGGELVYSATAFTGDVAEIVYRPIKRGIDD